MPTPNKFDVLLTLRDADDDSEPVEYSDVNYVSFVNDQTFGIPPLITENKVKDELPATILYVNINKVAAIEVTRES